MKPSFTNQRNIPMTDRKFHPTDEHLIEENKEEVVKINHGDKLEPEKRHNHDNEEEERASAP